MYGVWGEFASTAGVCGSGAPWGVYGVGSSYGLYGIGDTYGVYGVGGSGTNPNVSGAGIVGTGTSYGVCGGGSPIGVFGQGTTCGMYGTAGLSIVPIAGIGVAGAGSNYGLYGQGNYGLVASGSHIGVASFGGDFCFYAEVPYGTGAVSANSAGKYGPFTGAHDCLLPKDHSAFKIGVIVCSTGNTHTLKDPKGNIDISYTLPLVKLADKPNDKTVFGVFLNTFNMPDHWYKGKEQKGIINAVGEGRVWVSDINGPVEAGDFITTSYVAGYGQKQDDDLKHTYTLGKATEQVDWNKVNNTVEYKGKKYKAYLIAVTYTSG
jgi:hypothetical protein